MLLVPALHVRNGRRGFLRVIEPRWRSTARKAFDVLKAMLDFVEDDAQKPVNRGGLGDDGLAVIGTTFQPLANPALNT
jgi:hypothetical protein